MHRKVLLLPAVVLGMVIGPMVLEFRVVFGQFKPLETLVYSGVLVSLLAIYAGLTFLVFRVRARTFGLSPDQLRLAWFGAFVLGAVGMPVVYRIVNL